MKKILMFMLAALLVTACGEKKKASFSDKEEKAERYESKDPVAKMKAILNNFMSDLEDAETMEELLDCFKKYSPKLERMDEELSEEEQEALQNDPELESYMERLQEVAKEAGERCARNAIENGEDPSPYLEELSDYM